MKMQGCWNLEKSGRAITNRPLVAWAIFMPKLYRISKNLEGRSSWSCGHWGCQPTPFFGHINSQTKHCAPLFHLPWKCHYYPSLHGLEYCTLHIEWTPSLPGWFYDQLNRGYETGTVVDILFFFPDTLWSRWSPGQNQRENLFIEVGTLFVSVPEFIGRGLSIFQS